LALVPWEVESPARWRAPAGMFHSTKHLRRLYRLPVLPSAVFARGTGWHRLGCYEESFWEEPLPSVPLRLRRTGGLGCGKIPARGQLVGVAVDELMRVPLGKRWNSLNVRGERLVNCGEDEWRRKLLCGVSGHTPHSMKNNAES